MVLGRGDETGPWVKADAIMDAASRTNADVLVIADADVWCDGVTEAVEAVEQGAPWAIPHTLVRRLAEDGSEDERPYRGIEGGGIVVLRAETLADVPPDPRFVGWGQEDECWGLALRTLTGPPWRGTADLTHFWHPPQPRVTRRRGSRASWELRKRYFRALDDPAAMRDLTEEGDRPPRSRTRLDPLFAAAPRRVTAYSPRPAVIVTRREEATCSLSS